jgi:hypothetical protein
VTTRVCALVLSAAAWASTATAQPAVGGRFEVAVGALWQGGISMTALSATETQGSGAPRTVFDLSRELTSTVGLEARVGVRVTQRFTIEATGSYAQPNLEVTPSNDVEGAPAITASEPLKAFTIGGAVTWFVSRRQALGRVLPFVTAGLAYARQLHQPSTLADSGSVVDAGGGVEYILRTRARGVKTTGLRADGRARIRSSALAVDANTHVSPVFAGALFVRF